MRLAIVDGLYRTLDSDLSWWGVRRFKPAPDQPYTSRLLLFICLVYGLPAAALAWAGGFAFAGLVHQLNPLADDREWLPAALAWGIFVYNALANGVCCWLWNRRAARLNPTGFRRGARIRG